MLQKFGLLKYNSNSNFILKKQSSNNIYPAKSFNNSNLYSQSKTQRKNYVCKSFKNNLNINRLKKEDIIFRNELNNFIEESTSNIIEKVSPSFLVKINHNVDDNIIKRNNIRLNTSYKTQRNTNYFKINDYNIYNLINRKNKNKNDSNNSTKRNLKFLLYDSNLNNIQLEINDKKMLFKSLEIKNNSLENKINFIKNKYNNYLLTNTDTNKSYNNNLNNLKYMKTNTNSYKDNLSSLKNDINELKNQIIINNKEQKIIDLILFKEKTENELNKEDINKMNNLIEIINEEIKDKKKQISEIRKKSKMLIELINLKI